MEGAFVIGPQRHHTDSILPWTVIIRAWVDRSRVITLYSVPGGHYGGNATDKTLALLCTLPYSVPYRYPGPSAIQTRHQRYIPYG